MSASAIATTWLEVQGRRTAVLRSGPADGAPVLMVPGFTGSKEDFVPLLEPLGAAGFAVTALDLPGQHESEPLPPGGSYSPDSLAAVVLAVAGVVHPDGPVHLVGHSFGGLVARAAVLADPSVAATLVLLSSGPADLGGTRRAMLEHLGPVLGAGGVPGLYEALLSLAGSRPVGPATHLTPELLRTRFLAQDADMLLGMGEALQSEPDRVADLAAVAPRTLVVHGVDDDAWTPQQQHDMARRLSARYEVVPGAAHSAAAENPAALLRILLDFWGAPARPLTP